MPRGGYRPGAGRPKKSKNGEKLAKPKQTKSVAKKAVTSTPVDAAKSKPDESLVPVENLDPLEYMIKVINDPKADQDRRDRMAIAAAPFVHSKTLPEVPRKKQEKQEAASEAGKGKFAPSQAPRLPSNKLQ